MYRSEAFTKMWEIFQLGQEYERYQSQERRCVAGSKKSKEYRDKMRKCYEKMSNVREGLGWHFKESPYAFTATDYAVNRQ